MHISFEKFPSVDTIEEKFISGFSDLSSGINLIFLCILIVSAVIMGIITYLYVRIEAIHSHILTIECHFGYRKPLASTIKCHGKNPRFEAIDCQLVS